MRMQVIGEGANLGLTQAARIEFARGGGRVNTDAIDKSAGVDSSDHEVNIKILLSAAIEQGELKASAREDLLKVMTDDVAEHVLRHNYDQTRAISYMRSHASRDLDAYGRMMAAMEAEGRLDRALENLPDEKRLVALKKNDRGLTRPELAVLFAYSKLELFDAIVTSDTPDDPVFEAELFNYFPSQVHGFTQAIRKHRLRREIIATRLSNEMLNTCGAVFAHRAREATGAGFPQIALAYEGARRILDFSAFAAEIDALDNHAPTTLQMELYDIASTVIGEQVYQILGDVEASEVLAKRGVKGLVETYRGPVLEIKNAAPGILPAGAASAFLKQVAAWREGGAPELVATAAAAARTLEFSFKIVNLARQSGWPATSMAALFFAAGDALNIDSARTVSRARRFEHHYDRMAMRRLTEDMTIQQGQLALNVAAFAGEPPSGAPNAWVGDLIGQWMEAHDALIGSLEDYVAGLEFSAGVSVGKVTLLARKLSELVDRTRRR